MKKLLLLFVAFSLTGIYSCDKLDSPGNIQGMGDETGDLQISESFKLPAGIYLIGDITGSSDPLAKGEGKKQVFDDSKAGYSVFGSGNTVRLQLTLLNTRNYPITVFFPKGLLWKCKSANFQHSLQAQTTWVNLQPNTKRNICIDLYCVNKSVPAPDQTGTYTFLGITSSRIVWNLLNLIGWRKINYEMIHGSLNASKGYEEAGPTYDEITDKLQAIVHNLTDLGIDITADDKAFIESIPELSSTEIPQLDANLQYPEYFNEFVVPGK